MKEKIRELKNKSTTWWKNNRHKVIELGLAGGALYMLGHINATNKMLNHDRVLMEDDQGGDDIEVIDL